MEDEFKDEEILVPMFDLKEKKITMAQDFVDNKAYISQVLTVSNGKENKKVLALISSDKKYYIINELNDLNKYGFCSDYLPNKIENRWSMNGMKLFFNGNCPTITLKKSFEIIKSELKVYMDFTDERTYDFIATWILGTYFHQMFNTFPYIYVNAMKGSGKTKLLTLISCTAFNAKFNLSLTLATIFRLIQGNRCTLIMDEEEKLVKKDIMDYRSILLSGYKKGVKVPRAQESGKKGNFDVVEYAVFAPKIMANIGGIEDVLQDRCITLILLKTMNKKKGNLEIDINNEKWQNIRDKLYVNLMKNHSEISRCYNLLTDYYALSSDVCDVIDVSVDVLETYNTDIIKKSYLNNDTQTTLTTQTPQEITKILDGINSRNLELWLPLFSIGLSIDESLFFSLVSYAKSVIKDKEMESSTENPDIILIEALIDMITKPDWYNLKSIQSEMLKAYGFDEAQQEGGWINLRWLGRALKRIGLTEKKRMNNGVLYYISPDTIKNLAMRHSIGLEKYVKINQQQL